MSEQSYNKALLEIQKDPIKRFSNKELSLVRTLKKEGMPHEKIFNTIFKEREKNKKKEEKEEKEKDLTSKNGGM